MARLVSVVCHSAFVPTPVLCTVVTGMYYLFPKKKRASGLSRVQQGQQESSEWRLAMCINYCVGEGNLHHSSVGPG
jgi:hypothetical protein